MKNTYKMIRYPVVIILLLTLAACKNNQISKPVTAATTDTVPVIVLHDTIVERTIELPAELLPLEKTDLFARVQGYVKEIRVDIGDRVKRGQTIALIEAPELQTKYAEYQSVLQAAKAKYMSSTDLYQRLWKASQAKTAGIVAPVDLDKNRNQMQADSSSYEAARKLAQSYKEIAGYLAIESPFDGVITARNADKGALVGTSQVIVTVQNQQKLRLRAAVPEIYIGTKPAETSAHFRVDAYPEKSFMANLTRKSGVIDATTRTELWEYVFDNSKNELKAGAFAYLKLKLKRDGNSFVVPISAIATNQERRFVMVVKEGEITWVDIRQGITTEKGQEIFGNIGNGDTLVIRATDERKPGSTAYWKMKH